ncbi:response regulator transcription factor [Actinoplanes sp. LDG1-01]|uniref:Response regulator transcription factor n=2 Tax=Paractinoplanes lichenicola TaxID=2802976 RepID=A0ABS1VFQ3_9ACTN|nr:response regulator transcription factor [Actinoplanes lichenicola]
MVRAGFTMIIDAAPDLSVVGQAADGQSALTMLRAPGHQSDVVLMDIRMPGLDGVETTRRLLATAGPPRVVMLTTFDADDLLVAALRAGASGYLLKDAGPAELLAGIRSAAAGEAPVAPRLVGRLIDSFVRPVPAPAAPEPALDRLTGREREILAAVGLGLTNAEIAARLHVAESTVKTHLGAVLRKLDLRDRVQAVILAQSLGR